MDGWVEGLGLGRVKEQEEQEEEGNECIFFCFLSK